MSKRGDVSRVANKVEGHPVLQVGARVGYAISGVLHLVIGWIALQVAWSGSGTSADESGALATLATNTLGRLTLWLAVVGFSRSGCGISSTFLRCEPPRQLSVAGPGQGHLPGGPSPVHCVDVLQHRQRKPAQQQGAKHRPHRHPAAADRGPTPGLGRRPGRHRGGRLPRGQGLDQEVPHGPQKEPRHPCHSRRGRWLHRQGNRPGSGSGFCSSPRQCRTQRPRRPGSTGRCVRCVSKSSVPGC